MARLHELSGRGNGGMTDRIGAYGRSTPLYSPDIRPKHAARPLKWRVGRSVYSIWLRLQQYLGRETVGSWLFPLLLVSALTALHQIGAFGIVDGRLFDAATTRFAGSAPKVVVIEQGERFDQAQAGDFVELEAELARLGVDRIGYLGARPSNLGIPKRGDVPIVVGLDVEPIPASEKQRLNGTIAKGAIGAARSLPQSDYGIFRAQQVSLVGEARRIPTFETALAGRDIGQARYLVQMPHAQSIPSFTAQQIVERQLQPGELTGVVAIIAPPDALKPALATPLTPETNGTSEARFRAFATQNLMSGQEIYAAPPWELGLMMIIAGLVLALAFSRIDPKRFAIIMPLGFSLFVLVGAWAALLYVHKLLPVTALLLSIWIITFHRVLLREKHQDMRLEGAASRAVQYSFRRTALREGARLPEFLGTASRIAGIEKSLLIEFHRDGGMELVHAQNAALHDLAVDDSQLAAVLNRLRGRSLSASAQEFVVAWGQPARVAWLGGAHGDLFWIYAVPQNQMVRKSQRLVRAMTASFRELFRWRSDLNARSQNDERHMPIDGKVTSAISLISRESEQIRHGIDALDTAVVIFHLIGSPLHANARMHDIFRRAGIAVSDTNLHEALLKLTELDASRIEVMLQDLLLNGGEMRVPMRELGGGERMIRIAAPGSLAKREGRVLVVEAIDVANLNRAADLRQAVAQFIDAQLRNDLEAILLGANLAADPRMSSEQIKPLISRIGDTARRGTTRLDEVTGLIRARNSQTVGACYPLDARKLVIESYERVIEFADDLAVDIALDMPGIGGFTVAEPSALGDMLCAMLRVVLADTPRGDRVKLKLEELEDRTRIRITGGFGIGFERLVELLSGSPDEAVGDYKLIADGMAKALQWDASVSYWGREADGFGFNVDLRRIG